MSDYRNSDVLAMHVPKFPNMACENVEMITTPDECDQRQKRTCVMCVHRNECLELALSFGKKLEGVWGGTNKRDRKRIVKARQALGITPAIDETNSMIDLRHRKKAKMV